MRRFNPRISPEDFDFKALDLDENIARGKLPTEGFIGWDKDTYQINFHSRPVSKNYQFADVFLPKHYWDGRILFGTRLTALDPILKSKDPTLIAGLQYQVHKEKDAIEVHFMATKPKWRRKGVMSFLIAQAMREHGINNVEYWHPTEAGVAFGKKRKP